jgi:hypothetical protein
MIETKYIGQINGVDTWEVYLEGQLIGINQSAPEETEE